MIGEDIILEVKEIDRGKVRIGIIAPRDVPVLRKELGTYDPNHGVAVTSPHPVRSTS